MPELPAALPANDATGTTTPVPWLLAALPTAALVAFATAMGLRHNGRLDGLAMLLGPWAGLPLGHRDCTMATQMPAATLGVVLAAPIVFGTIVALRGRARSVVGALLLGTWLLVWTALGAMSLINASM